MYFLIAYDITNPRRLARVARRLRKHALRVQYSVFLHEGTRATLRQILDEAAAFIDRDRDRIQGWAIDARETPHGESRGRPLAVIAASAVLAAGGNQQVPPPSSGSQDHEQRHGLPGPALS